MFTHITVGSNDLDASRTFYDAVLATLDMQGSEFGVLRIYKKGGQFFGFRQPRDGEAACSANGGTIGFVAETKEQGDAFHAAVLAITLGGFGVHKFYLGQKGWGDRLLAVLLDLYPAVGGDLGVSHPTAGR